jgi:colanic acid/amylovoran biosynthesis glycosyltransferase
MDYPLAIFAPEIGARSETFVRRHCQELLPGSTAVVGYVLRGAEHRDWVVKGPVLDLSPLWRRALLRVTGVMAGIPRLRGAQDLDLVKRFLRKHNIRVIVGEYLDTSLAWQRTAQELGIRFFAHAHGYDVSIRLRQPRWRAEYLRYNEAAGVITMSQASRTRLINLGLAPDKVHVVPYGVDVPAEPRQRPARGCVRCVAVGRMVTKKAPLLTLEAFRRAAEACPELRLDYVGGGHLLPAAQQFVRDNGLDDRVSLHGGQPNHVVQRVMKDADIYVQHSMTDLDTGDEEGLPVAILEAMAHALPVVSTRHAGIPEAVLDTSTGYLVDERDSERMAEVITTLVRDPDMRGRMGQAGWARASEYFSWDRERAELLRILGLE